MTAVEQALKYKRSYVVLPGHNSEFERRTGRTGHRWDGSFIDTVLWDSGISTVSFTDATTALAVLTQQGKIRKRHRAKPGDVAFLAYGGYVGLVLDTQSKTHVTAAVGWWPGQQGKRHLVRLSLNRAIDVLAFADPVLPVRQRVAVPAVEVTDRKQIADLLSLHPAVDEFVAPVDFHSAYARWQRYCGYAPDKANGVPDARSLERLCREERGKP